MLKFFLFLSFTTAAIAANFEIKDGDRVLLLGDSLLEREQGFGSLETRMHEQFPKVRFSVRNLSWNGDTPRGWSRAAFDGPDKGWERLKEQIALVKPTVAILGYGMAASLQEMTDRSGDIMLNRDPARYGAEPMSAARFKKELGELMDAIGKDTRFILLSPIRHEDLRGGLPAEAPKMGARLEFRMVHPKSEKILEGIEAKTAVLDPAYEIVDYKHREKGKDITEKMIVSKKIEITGDHLSSAKAVETDFGSWDIHLQFDSKGTDLFTRLTARMAAFKGARERFATILDNVVIQVVGLSDETIEKGGIRGGKAVITGDREEAEARKIAQALLAPIEKPAAAAPAAVSGARPGMPDPAPHNALLEQYSKAIEELAKERGALFRPFFQPQKEGTTKVQLRGLTENGIHLGAEGHRFYFTSLADSLAPNQRSENAINPSLRAAILKKNDLFFHRTRPANSTYLFGFRKREQGRNAVEIPRFDPLVEAADAEIDRLKRAPSSETSAAPKVPAAPAPENPAKPLPLPNFTVQDGYEITLWADTPLVGKPVGMNWDAAGRLWVACSPVYPMIAPGAHPEDKVVVLEDTDHDGKADKSTTFATDLLIAASVAPDFATPNGGAAGRAGFQPAVPGLKPGTPNVENRPATKERPTKSEGPGKIPGPAGNIPALPSAAYVTASTELLRLEDTDGDGKADTRRAVLSGFGTEDTHHTIHTLRWGPDGRLYFNQSIYIHSHIETPHGMVRLNSAGILAYDPRTERTEVHAKGWCNPWGHVWDEWGQEFVTDGAGGQGISWLIPGAMYFTYENARRICPSVSPGSYPKFCGLELIRSPLFPADWQGTAVTGDFRAHRVARFEIRDLSTDKMDKTDASIPSTKSMQSIKSGYQTKDLPDLVRTGDASFRPIDLKMGPDGALYIADWTNPIINHGEVDFRDPRRDHVNGRIWRLAPKGKAPLAWNSHSTAPPAAIPKGRKISEAKGLIRDPHPRVRLEAMRALSRIPTADSAALVLEAAVNPPSPIPNANAGATSDAHYAYAAWLSVNDLAPQVIEWMERSAGGAENAQPASHAAMISYALQNLPAEKTSSLLSNIITKTGLPKDGSGPWIELIGSSGGPKELRALFDILTKPNDMPPFAPRVLTALSNAARSRNAKPEGDLSKMEGAAAGASEELVPASLTLLGDWKMQSSIPLLEKYTHAGIAAHRAAAFDALAAIGGEAATKAVAAALTGNAAPTTKRQAVVALARLDAARAHVALKDIVAEGDEPTLLPLWRELFKSEGFKTKFASDIPRDLPKPALAAALRAARELGKKGEKLATALTPLTNEAPAPGAQDFAALAELTKANGNPAEGEILYRRAALACTVCHAIGGAGGKVGPDMTTLGASAPLDYIIESVMAPAAKVKEGYNAVALTLKGGRNASGILLRDTDKDVLLRDATGAETVIPKGDITARENIGSLMPAGLLAQLTDRDKAHVIAFLAALGKPGPFDTTKATVARSWELFPGKEGDSVIAGKPAKPGVKVLTMVDGRLLKTQITETLPLIPAAGDSVVAITRFSGAGKTRLNLQGVTKAWLDGAPLAIASEPNPEIELSNGNHVLAVKLEIQNLPAQLRAACADARFANE